MIKVYFIHPSCSNIDDFASYICISEDLKKNLIWDSVNPDILFASEWVYNKKTAFKKFRKLWNKAKVKVMYAAEAIEPDFNLFDYFIGFSNKCQMGDRFIRILSPLDMFSGFITTVENDICTLEKAADSLKQKHGFCNFLYSNWNAHPRRDQLFYALSSYKKVDSLGKHLNNVGKLGTGFVGHASECSDIKSLYKFSIASENATFDGYTSEKVYTSLVAHTIPIYWGNKDIEEDVNPKAIINANNFSSLKELIDYVKYVDTNDSVWMQMVAEPWMTEEQMLHHKQRTSEYYSFFKWLFSGNLEEKKRLAFGTAEQNYRMFLFDHIFSRDLNMKTLPRYIKILKNKMKRIING